MRENLWDSRRPARLADVIEWAILPWIDARKIRDIREADESNIRITGDERRTQIVPTRKNGRVDVNHFFLRILGICMATMPRFSTQRPRKNHGPFAPAKSSGCGAVARSSAFDRLLMAIEAHTHAMQVATFGLIPSPPRSPARPLHPSSTGR